MPIIGSFGAGAGRGFGQRGGGGSTPFVEATGGTITTCGNYTIHTFTGPGTFCVSKLACCAADNEISYVVVAGGGGGGSSQGGGGGAGGFREGKSTVDCFTASPLVNTGGITLSCVGGIPVTVGGGGTGWNPTNRAGQRGTDSIFSSITSTGGGGGGGGNPPPTSSGQPGGSGGGGGGVLNTGGGSGNTPPVSPPQGENGSPAGAPNAARGGGGGATQAGAPSPGPSFTSGAGGDGANTEFNPSTCVGTPGPAPGRWFAGGAASCDSGTNGGYGGGAQSVPNPCTAGQVNTGGGGRSGDYGGSGIVMIRYKTGA